jgi:hypothetical protein
LNSHNYDSILGVEKHVDDQHPPPGAEHETKARPAPTQFRPQPWKVTEWTQCALKPLFGVPWKAMCPDQSLQIGRGRPGNLDPCHGLEIVEVDRPASFGVLEPSLGLLKRSGQAVQEGSYVARIRVGLVERL